MRRIGLLGWEECGERPKIAPSKPLVISETRAKAVVSLGGRIGLLRAHAEH